MANTPEFIAQCEAYEAEAINRRLAHEFRNYFFPFLN